MDFDAAYLNGLLQHVSYPARSTIFWRFGATVLRIVRVPQETIAKSERCPDDRTELVMMARDSGTERFTHGLGGFQGSVGTKRMGDGKPHAWDYN